jgi:hypothetical protein
VFAARDRRPRRALRRRRLREGRREPPRRRRCELGQRGHRGEPSRAQPARCQRRRPTTLASPTAGRAATALGDAVVRRSATPMFPPRSTWVPLARLLQPRTRAGELAALDRRLRAEVAADVDDEERELARAVGDAKRAVAAAVPAVDACGTCAAGHPLPIGQHAGGACCAGVTAELFDDDELAALALAGTRPPDLQPPSRRHPHAGCAFRGATGCSLALAHRPARCVRFFCHGLRAELHRRGAPRPRRGSSRRARRRDVGLSRRPPRPPRSRGPGPDPRCDRPPHRRRRRPLTVGGST